MEEQAGGVVSIDLCNEKHKSIDKALEDLNTKCDNILIDVKAVRGYVNPVLPGLRQELKDHIAQHKIETEIKWKRRAFWISVAAVVTTLSAIFIPIIIKHF